MDMLTPNARDVWRQASAILLNDDTNLDANERVGLMTVIAGLRSAALFLYTPRESVKRLSALLRHVPLVSVLAPALVPAYTYDSPHPPEITSIFRKRPRVEEPALWVCSDAEEMRRVKQGVDQCVAGRLLRYPECCIEAQQQEKALFEDAVIRGFSTKFGPDPANIARAFFDNCKVAIDFEPTTRISSTVAAFPFVQHIACEMCLRDKDSSTSQLNRRYGDLLAEVDPYLHGYLGRLGARHQSLATIAYRPGLRNN